MTAKTGHLYRFRTYFESPIAVVISAHDQKLAKSYRSCFDIFWVPKTQVLLGKKKSKKYLFRPQKVGIFWHKSALESLFFAVVFLVGLFFYFLCGLRFGARTVVLSRDPIFDTFSALWSGEKVAHFWSQTLNSVRRNVIDCHLKLPIQLPHCEALVGILVPARRLIGPKAQWHFNPVCTRLCLEAIYIRS